MTVNRELTSLESGRRYCLRCYVEIDDSVNPGATYNAWRYRLRAYCVPCRRVIVDHIYRVPSPRDPDPAWERVARVFVMLILFVAIVVMLTHWFPGGR